MTHTAQMNGFKETEIGEIPAEWEIKPLNEVATFTRKPRGLALSEYGQIPFIPMELIPDDGLVVHKYDLKSGEEIRSGTYFEAGDVLLSKITPSFENGKQGIPQDLPLPFGYATTEIYPLRAKPDILDQLFLFYFFRIPHVRADIANKMEGTTGRQRIPKAVIETYPIPLPPLPEQRRIAAALSTIQRAITAQDDVIAAAKELKRSLMQRLFTYGPGREPAETKETEIGKIPTHWEVVELGELSNSVRYGTSQRCTEDSNGLPVLRIPNVIGGRIDTSDLKYTVLPDKEIKKLQMREGDLLFVRTNGQRDYIGRSAVFHQELPSALFASYLIRVRLKTGKAIPEFVNSYLLTDSGRSQLIDKASGAADGKYNINSQTIRAVQVPIPQISEQLDVVRMLNTADRKITAEENRKAALQELFCSALHQLMTGQIRLLNDMNLPSHLASPG